MQMLRHHDLFKIIEIDPYATVALCHPLPLSAFNYSSTEANVVSVIGEKCQSQIGRLSQLTEFSNIP